MTEGMGVANLSVIADFQFGAGAGTALFATPNQLDVKRSKSGRPRQVIGPDGRLVSLTATGRFTLGVAGGVRLREALDPPKYRVTVTEDSVPFVRDGRSAFAKFVTEVDPEIRQNDEVLVVDGDGALIGVGRAELSASAMEAFDSGVAVMVREGIGE